MTLSFKVLGFELATISIDLPVYEKDEVSIVDDAAKSVSRWFFDRMVR